MEKNSDKVEERELSAEQQEEVRGGLTAVSGLSSSALKVIRGGVLGAYQGCDDGDRSISLFTKLV
jgi:hypothetical protein